MNSKGMLSKIFSDHDFISLLRQKRLHVVLRSRVTNYKYVAFLVECLALHGESARIRVSSATKTEQRSRHIRQRGVLFGT